MLAKKRDSICLENINLGEGYFIFEQLIQYDL